MDNVLGSVALASSEIKTQSTRGSGQRCDYTSMGFYWLLYQIQCLEERGRKQLGVDRHK